MHRLIRTWVPVFDSRVDPLELRLRAAAVIISLATGPFRGQEPEWEWETLRMILPPRPWCARSADVVGRTVDTPVCSCGLPGVRRDDGTGWPGMTSLWGLVKVLLGAAGRSVWLVGLGPGGLVWVGPGFRGVLQVSAGCLGRVWLYVAFKRVVPDSLHASFGGHGWGCSWSSAGCDLDGFAGLPRPGWAAAGGVDVGMVSLAVVVGPPAGAGSRGCRW